MKNKIEIILLIILNITFTFQKDCSPDIKDCINCDDENECIECLETYFLNITKKPFQCEACPDSCKRCNSAGCAECLDGYFKNSFRKFKIQVFVCDKCDESCETCDDKSTLCTSCPEYYGLKEDQTCVFKYTRLIAIGLIMIVLLLMVMIFLIAKCVCLEKAPEKESYGSILTQDNDLMSDYYKTSRNEIGMNFEKNEGNNENDSSMVSNVKPIDDNSYLNISNVSIDPVISTLLGRPTGVNNFDVSEQGDDIEEPGDAWRRARGGTTADGGGRGKVREERIRSNV